MPPKTPASLVEARIAEAFANGVFDDLPGEGKPLELDDLQGLTPDQRIEALVLRSSGEVSGETALLREIQELRARLERTEDPDVQERMRTQMRQKADEVSALFSERRRDALEAKKPLPR